ncbi:MAG: DsbA family protein [Chlamydiales bacterium]|nr:DsbA family protein [Chlamydiales bacterium]
MKHFYTAKHLLVIGTACLALIGVVFAWYYSSKRPLSALRVEMVGCPVLGEVNAPIKMVLFEDFLCEHCQAFNREVLPKIKQEYIDSGLVNFTIVPLAFLRGSKPLANAVLEVFEIAPDRFLPYLKELGHWVNDEESLFAVQQKLVDLAQIVGGIDLMEFQSCVRANCHEMQLEKNLELAKEIMGKNFGTPALYINGVSSSAHSFEAIQSRVEILLK